MPSRSARLAAETKASRMRARPAASSASGGASPSLCGTAEGPTVCQPPSASGISCPPSHGRWLEPLRPAWASCIATAVFECLRTDVEDRLQRGFGGVVPQPEAARRDAADGLDMGGLDAEHRRARQRQRVDVGEMPVIGRAVVGRVLAHRRHHDAVGKRKAAQLDRGKQGAHAGISWGGRKERRRLVI